MCSKTLSLTPWETTLSQARSHATVRCPFLTPLCVPPTTHTHKGTYNFLISFGNLVSNIELPSDGSTRADSRPQRVLLCSSGEQLPADPSQACSSSTSTPPQSLGWRKTTGFPCAPTVASSLRLRIFFAFKSITAACMSSTWRKEGEHIWDHKTPNYSILTLRPLQSPMADLLYRWAEPFLTHQENKLNSKCLRVFNCGEHVSLQPSSACYTVWHILLAGPLGYCTNPSFLRALGSSSLIGGWAMPHKQGRV